MSDVRDRVINNLKNLPETAGYDEILKLLNYNGKLKKELIKVTKANIYRMKKLCANWTNESKN